MANLLWSFEISDRAYWFIWNSVGLHSASGIWNRYCWCLIYILILMVCVGMCLFVVYFTQLSTSEDCVLSVLGGERGRDE